MICCKQIEKQNAWMLLVAPMHKIVLEHEITAAIDVFLALNPHELMSVWLNSRARCCDDIYSILSF